VIHSQNRWACRTLGCISADGYPARAFCEVDPSCLIKVSITWDHSKSALRINVLTRTYDLYVRKQLIAA